jgi:hypothetical protein
MKCTHTHTYSPAHEGNCEEIVAYIREGSVDIPVFRVVVGVKSFDLVLSCECTCMIVSVSVCERSVYVCVCVRGSECES